MDKEVLKQKLSHFSGMAMIGILANPNTTERALDKSQIAEMAIGQALELISQIEELEIT